jgi:hypothetical protein
MAASCMSKFVTIAFVNPIIVVKTKLEVVGCLKYSGPVDCAAKIYKGQGVAGFYKVRHA